MKFIPPPTLQAHLDCNAASALERLHRSPEDARLVRLIDEAIKREDLASARSAVELGSSDEVSLDLGAYFDAALMRRVFDNGTLFFGDVVETASFYATDAARLQILNASDGIVDFRVRKDIEKQRFNRARDLMGFAYDDELFNALQEALDLAVGDAAIGLIEQGMVREAFEKTASASGVEGQQRIAVRINSLLSFFAQEQISCGRRTSALGVIRQMTPWAVQVRELESNNFKPSDAMVINHLPALSDLPERFDFSQRFCGVTPVRDGQSLNSRPSTGAVVSFF